MHQGVVFAYSLYVCAGYRGLGLQLASFSWFHTVLSAWQIRAVCFGNFWSCFLFFNIIHLNLVEFTHFHNQTFTITDSDQAGSTPGSAPDVE